MKRREKWPASSKDEKEREMASVAEMKLEKRQKATATFGTIVPTNGIQLKSQEPIAREASW
jgi:hypothetical protein